VRFLVAHNAYREPGGEDAVFRSETRLLRQTGHEVLEYVESNCRIEPGNYLRVGAETVWSDSSLKKLRTAIGRFRPDLVHFHNTFPLISPAAYSACDEVGLPVVQTLHNYRLVCPSGLFYRNGHPCEDCLPKRVKWPGVLHACYRDNRMATTAVASMLAIHRALGTWHEKVTRFIALSEFSRHKFVRGGLPAEKTVVKPNFVSPDPGARTGMGDYVLFVGRLSEEKGVRSLLRAWSMCSRDIPLRIVGDGPLRRSLESEKESLGLSNIRFEGRLEQATVVTAMKQARLLVFPSTCYENFPLVIAEAYACGVPVVASRLGAMADIVQDGVTGLLFEPASAEDLADKVACVWARHRRVEEMGRAARAEFEAKYTAQRSYQDLMKIYAEALVHTAGDPILGPLRWKTSDSE
jgi:glycosyltransferase involved in cell wall biosynthesis